MRKLLQLGLLVGVSAAFADNYPRQPGIDAQHYIFRVTLSDDTDEVAGEATADLTLRERRGDGGRARPDEREGWQGHDGQRCDVGWRAGEVRALGDRLDHHAGGGAQGRRAAAVHREVSRRGGQRACTSPGTSSATGRSSAGTGPRWRGSGCRRSIIPTTRPPASFW